MQSNSSNIITKVYKKRRCIIDKNRCSPPPGHSLWQLGQRQDGRCSPQFVLPVLQIWDNEKQWQTPESKIIHIVLCHCFVPRGWFPPQCLCFCPLHSARAWFPGFPQVPGSTRVFNCSTGLSCIWHPELHSPQGQEWIRSGKRGSVHSADSSNLSEKRL